LSGLSAIGLPGEPNLELRSGKMLKNAFIFAIVAGFLLAPASAETYQWDAGVGTGDTIQDGGGTWQVSQPNWYNQTTFSSDQTWVDGNDAVFGGGAGGTAGTVAITGTVNAGSVTLNDPFDGEYTLGGSGTLNTSGTLTKIGSATVTLGGTAGINPGGSQISGGRLVIETSVANVDSKVFRNNWGTEVEIKGNGSLTVGGAPQFLFGDITLRDNALMGWYGPGNFELDDGTGSPQPSTLTIMDNATFEVDRNGTAHGYTGTVGLNAQGYKLGGFCYGLQWNQYSTVTIDQQGGTVNLTNLIADTGSPWSDIGGGGAGVGMPGLVLAHEATGTEKEHIDHKYNLSGGVLNVSGVFCTTSFAPTGPSPAADGDGNGFAPVFNFNGGTMRASQSDSTDPNAVAEGWNHLMGNLWHAYVQEGGAIIDTNTFDASIDQGLEHDPDLGDTPDGGLQKLGDGTLTLLRTNTYTGDTTVDAGVLEVAHASLHDASSVSVGSGAMMDLNFTDTDRIAALNLDGVSQTVGFYNSGNAVAFLAGAGSLLVVRGDLNWRAGAEADWTSANWTPDGGTSYVAPGGGEIMTVDSGIATVSTDMTALEPVVFLFIARDTAGGTVEIAPSGKLAVLAEVNVGDGGALSVNGSLAMGGLNVAVGGTLALGDGSTIVSPATAGTAPVTITVGGTLSSGGGNSMFGDSGGDTFFTNLTLADTSFFDWTFTSSAQTDVDFGGTMVAIGDSVNVMGSVAMADGFTIQLVDGGLDTANGLDVALFWAIDGASIDGVAPDAITGRWTPADLAKITILSPVGAPVEWTWDSLEYVNEEYIVLKGLVTGDSGPPPGDANGDNKVDYADAILFDAQLGARAPGQSCDFNGDGMVDLLDQKILKDNWLRGAPTAPEASASLTPEPSSAILLLLGLGAVIRRRC